MTGSPDDTGPVNVDGPTPRGIRAPGTAGAQAGNAGAADARTPATGVPAQPAQQPDDRNAAALFRVHMFPIGHLPVPSSRPAAQLPTPEGTATAQTDRNDPWGVSSDVNTESIMRWLDAVGVPRDVISVGAETDNAWCLLRSTAQTSGEADGTVTWDVFWQEQGNRHDWARFSSEQVACHYLFGRLTWAQVARGAVGTTG